MRKWTTLAVAALLVGCGNMPADQEDVQRNIERVETTDGYACYVYTAVDGVAMDCVPVDVTDTVRARQALQTEDDDGC